MLEAAYRAARRRAPNLLLVLTGANEGMPEGLLGAARRGVPQRSGGALHVPLLRAVPVHASGRVVERRAPSRRRAVSGQRAAAARQPRRHRGGDRGLEPVAAAEDCSPRSRRAACSKAIAARASTAPPWARSLDRIVAWATSNGVAADRIFLGEFGALKSDRQAHGVRAAERRQWFADVRAEAEARGFSWAVWVYRLGGFALVNDDRGVDVDPVIIDALGLTSHARHSAAPRQ